MSVIPGNNLYCLVDGFRRTTAAKELGWAKIHAAIYPALSDNDAKKLAFVKNVARKNLTPVEKANAIHLAKREGYAVDEAARLFGVSTRTVWRYLQMPECLLAVIDGKRITMAHGNVLARLCANRSGHIDEDVLATLVNDIRANGLTPGQLARRPRLARRALSSQTRRALVTDEAVRLYAFRLSAKSSPRELRSAAEDLRIAAQRLDQFATGRPCSPASGGNDGPEVIDSQ